MTVAASVTTTIVIKGNDQASKSIKKSQTAMDKLRGSMDKAQTKSAALGNSLRSIGSGDVMGSLSGISGALGGGGGGIAAAATMATAATAAFVAGAALATFKVAEWSEQIERLRVEFNNAFGPDGVQKALAYADAIGGVTAESVGKLGSTIRQAGIQSQFTVAQLQELTNRAAKAGKTGDEALQGLNRALQTGTTRALKQVGVYISSTKVMKDYADSIGKVAQDLTDMEKQEAVAAAITKELSRATDATTTAHHNLDSVLARVNNSILRVKLAMSDIVGGESAKLLTRILDLVDATARWSGAIISFVKVGLTPFNVAIRFGVAWTENLFNVFKVIADGGTLTQVGDALDKLASKVKASLDPTRDARNAWTALTNAWDGTKPNVGAVLQANDAIRGMTGIATSAADRVKGIFDSIKSGTASIIAGSSKVAKALGSGFNKADEARRAKRLAAARSAAKTARALAVTQEKEFWAELKTVRDKAASDDIERRRSEIAATAKRNDDLRALVDLENQMAQIKAAGDPVAVAHLQNLQTELDLQKQIAEIKANMSLTDAEQQRTIDAVKGIAHSKEMANIKAATNAQRAATQATIQGYLATGNAAAGALAEIGVAERAIAGIKAIMAGAEAFLAFARYDYAAGIAATTAAIQFGRIALTSPDVPAGAASAPSIAPTGIASPSASGEGGAATYNISINGVFATAAETGAAIKQAISAASGSGMKSAA